MDKSFKLVMPLYVWYDWVNFRRGFNSHYGYWLGAEDYFEHTQTYGVRNITGYDFRENDNVDQSSKGKYSAQLFADRAIDIIRQ